MALVPLTAGLSMVLATVFVRESIGAQETPANAFAVWEAEEEATSADAGFCYLRANEEIAMTFDEFAATMNKLLSAPEDSTERPLWPDPPWPELTDEISEDPRFPQLLTELGAPLLRMVEEQALRQLRGSGTAPRSQRP